MGSGTIRTSLFAATDEARIPDAVATQLAEMFSTDIDFHRELRKRRHLHVVYEALTADGEPITWSPAAGRVLAAEFVNNGRSLLGGLVQGRRRQGRLLRPRRPEQAARVPRQPDGVLARDLRLRDAHAPDPADAGSSTTGVDYGAPTGTPVRSGRRRRRRLRRLAERLRQRGPDRARQRPHDRLCAPEPHRRAQGPARRAGRSASAPSARPAGPPARTCTSSSSVNGVHQDPLRDRARPREALSLAGRASAAALRRQLAQQRLQRRSSTSPRRCASPVAREPTPRPRTIARMTAVHRPDVGHLARRRRRRAGRLRADAARRAAGAARMRTGRSTPRCAPSCWR